MSSNTTNTSTTAVASTLTGYYDESTERVITGVTVSIGLLIMIGVIPLIICWWRKKKHSDADVASPLPTDSTTSSYGQAFELNAYTVSVV